MFTSRTCAALGFVAVAVLAPAAGAQVKHQGPGLFEIRGATRITASGGTKTATMLFPVALHYRDQVPLTCEIAVEPAGAAESIRIYRDTTPADPCGNYIAEVKLVALDEQSTVEVRFASLVLVRPSDFSDAPKTAKIPDEWPPEARNWLATTWCVEGGNERIAKIGRELREGTDDEMEIIARVIGRASKIQRAEKGSVKNLTAVEALDKQGSCTSNANLMAALLRAAGVPARVLSGYPSWYGALQTHYIVEAYVPDYGWYPIESTMCKAPWANDQQVAVTVTPVAYEKEEVAKTRRNSMGGVPYLSLTEYAPGGMFIAEGIVDPKSPYCDHVCLSVRGFAAEPAQWKETFEKAGAKWDAWLAGEPGASGALRFGAAELREAKDLNELVKKLD